MRPRTWTDQQFIEAAPKCLSIAQLARELGLAPRGGSYKTIKTHAARLNVDLGHFTGMGWNVGLKFHPKPAQPLESILVRGSSYQSHKLKLRLIREGRLAEKCSACGAEKIINPFTGELVNVPLELDHINGDNTDNRIENLRLLDPTCHALTPTYRGRNIKAHIVQ